MGFIRFLDGKELLHSWAVAVPDLKILLKSFLNKDEVGGSFPLDGTVEVSIYETIGPPEALQAAAAVWGGRKAKQKVTESGYGLALERTDWEPFGIVESVVQGETEIPIVDSWHRNLQGTKAEFARLAQAVVEAIWKGENRLRVFPSRQIGAEIAAIFSRMNEETDAGMRDLYSGILQMNPWLAVTENRNRVTITGTLRGFKDEIPISTERLV